MWKSYKFKEYLSIIRCFKCHGYGHISKNCESTDQLCVICGSKDQGFKGCLYEGRLAFLSKLRTKQKERYEP